MNIINTFSKYIPNHEFYVPNVLYLCLGIPTDIQLHTRSSHSTYKIHLKMFITRILLLSKMIVKFYVFTQIVWTIDVGKSGVMPSIHMTGHSLIIIRVAFSQLNG